MSAESDDAARRTALAAIAAERGGVSSPGAELARLHAQVADLLERIDVLETE